MSEIAYHKINYVRNEVKDIYPKISSIVYDLQKSLYTSKFRVVRNIKMVSAIFKMEKINKKLKKYLSEMMKNPKILLANMNILCQLFDSISEQFKVNINGSFINLGSTYKMTYSYIRDTKTDTLILNIPNWNHIPVIDVNHIDYIYNEKDYNKEHIYFGNLDSDYSPFEYPQILAEFTRTIVDFINAYTIGLVDNVISQYYDWRG